MDSGTLMTRWSRPVRWAALVPAAALALGMPSSRGQAAPPDAWQVAEAPLRFQVELTRQPSHPTAGTFLRLPDGGILPEPLPRPHVVSEDGTPLPSFVVWHGQDAGLGIVVDTPARARRVTVYVSGTRRLDLWSPDSGLTPSALLCIGSRQGSRRAAEALSRPGSVEGLVTFLNRPGCPEAPLSIPGDVTGREAPCSVAMLGYVDTRDPGRTWVAPVTFAGQTEVRLDGRTLEPETRVDKSGGTGEWVDLEQGLHHVEILCWSDRWTTRNGLMALTWKTPNTTIAQLGGKRPGGLPLAGTSMWASRHLLPEEIVVSGAGRVRAAEARDGTPVAWFSHRETHNFWFEDHDPVFMTAWEANTAGHPDGTRYVWSFGDAARVRQPGFSWVCRGRKEYRVTLTASSGRRSSRCTLPYYPFSDVRTSMQDPDTPAAYRAACRQMFESYPPDADPTAAWQDDMWAVFFRNMEFGKGADLLELLFDRFWERVGSRLSADRKALLEDMVLVTVERADPNRAVKLAERFERDAGTRERAGLLRLERAAMLMHDLGDLAAARALLKPLTRHHNDNAELAKVRLGDARFLEGNLNAATELYAAVQNRAAPARGRSGRERDGRVETWKVESIKDVFASETVKAYLEQDYLLKARHELREWERRFPMSKISRDFVPLEARLHMALGNWRRARSMLEAYCDLVDASSFMPDAVEAVLTCMLNMNEPPEGIREFCESVRDRVEFHPVASRIDRVLHELPSGGSTPPTPARP